MSKDKKKDKKKGSKKPVPRTNQERFDDLRERITELGTVLWECREGECRVNVYQSTHLEVSAKGYIKYESRGCDTPAKLLDAMRAVLKGVTKSLLERRDEINDALDALTTMNDDLE